MYIPYLSVYTFILLGSSLYYTSLQYCGENCPAGCMRRQLIPNCRLKLRTNNLRQNQKLIHKIPKFKSRTDYIVVRSPQFTIGGESPPRQSWPKREKNSVAGTAALLLSSINSTIDARWDGGTLCFQLRELKPIIYIYIYIK